MQRITSSDSQFHDGDPSTGVLGTFLAAAWHNAVQEEIAGFIEGAGVVLDPTNNGQLVKAFAARMTRTAPLADAGAINAYAAVNVVPLTAETLVHGVRQRITISTTNSGASTYSPDGLPPKPILGLDLLPLEGVELLATEVAELEYVVAAAVNGGNGAWLLLRCAGGAMQLPAYSYGVTPHAGDSSNNLATTASIPAQLQFVSASVAANALTLGFAPIGPMQFRNASLTNGAPIALSAAAIGALSLTIPSGATLGTVDAQAALLAIAVAYNAGAPVLCVANASGGLDMSETGFISPTTISVGATSNTTWYSAQAVGANSPYRIVGFVQITEAAAGIWATAPNLVQGTGGQAFADMQSLGRGQMWQNVLGSRAAGTTYYNTTGRPIGISIVATMTSPGNAELIVNGVAIPGSGNNWTGAPGSCVAAVVPPGGSYSLIASVGTATASTWVELR